MTEPTPDDPFEQEVVRVVMADIPESPLPEWKRTLFVRPSGDVLVAAGLVGLASKECLQECRLQRVPYLVQKPHYYYPTWWVMEMKPKYASICAKLEQRARELLQLELKKQGGSPND